MKRFWNSNFIGALAGVLALPAAYYVILYPSAQPAQATDQFGPPPNAIIGDVVNGHRDISITTDPGQTGSIVGQESSMTVCPDRLAPGQGAIGTYVGPNGSMNMTITASGSGSVIGRSSTMTIGGDNCK